MIAAASSARSFAVDTCCGARQPGRVDEVRVLHAQPRRFLVHALDERVLRSGDGFGERDRRIVARLHDHAVQQLVDADTAFFGSMNMREPSARHALSDTVTICEGMSSLSLQRAEDEVRGHQLGQRRRLARFVGVLRDQRLPAQDVEQEYALAAIAGGGTAADGAVPTPAAAPAVAAALALPAATTQANASDSHASGKNDMREDCGRCPHYTVAWTPIAAASSAALELEVDLGPAPGHDVGQRPARAAAIVQPSVPWPVSRNRLR